MLANPNSFALPGFNQTTGNLPAAFPAYGGPSTMMFPSLPGSTYPDFSTPISVNGGNVLVGQNYPAFQQPAYPLSLAYPAPQQNGDINNVVNILINILNQTQNQQVTQPAPQQNNFMFMLLAMLLGDKGGSRHYGGGNYAPAPAAPAAPKPRITVDSVEATGTTTGGRVWGDPHFVDFEGGHYDVMGEAGKVYNIISDSNIQFNAKFGAWKGQKDATIISEVGLKLGKPETGLTQVEFAMGGKAPIVNGKALQKGEKVTFDTGLNTKDGQPVAGSVTWDGKNMTVNSGEYILKLADAGDHLNHDVSITNLGVASDGVRPHGLLGQNADGQVDNGKRGKGAQGEGAIEGDYTQYQVQGLLDDNFRYNKFGNGPEQAQEFGLFAGKAAKAD